MAPIRLFIAAAVIPFLAFAQPAAEAKRMVPLPEYRAFSEKAARGETMRIAYLGGSITVGATTAPASGTNREGKPYAYEMNPHRDSWRAITFAWLRQRFEKRPGQFEQVDAAMGSTNSMFAAYRLAKDVLAYSPDFLFIEFAINDNRLGTATERDPDGANSIYRTYQSIVSRVRAANPDVAIFITISAHRPKTVGTALTETSKFDASARVTERVANYFHIPFLKLSDVFYREPLPAGLERDRLFDGPESAPNEVHPSAQGHRAYGEGVIRALERIFATGEREFSEVNLPAPQPYPQFAALYLPAEIAPHARGWKLQAMPSRWAIEPCLNGESSLVTSDPNATLVFPFSGKSIGAWFDTDGRGSVELYVDGRHIGVHVEKGGGGGEESDKVFPGRANLFATDLDPKVRHELRLVPSKGQKSFVISLHGILVEETADHGRDRLPLKRVDMSVFGENPRPAR